MFDFLKKKIAGFADKIKGALEQKKPEEAKTVPAPEQPKPAPTPVVEKHVAVQQKEPEKAVVSKPKEKKAVEKAKPVPKQVPAPVQPEEMIESEEPAVEEPTAIEKASQLIVEERRELKAKPKAVSQIKAIFTGGITIEPKDIESLLEEFELSLLESDVEQDTSKEIVRRLRQSLVGKKVQRSQNLNEFIRGEIKRALKEIMEVPAIDFFEQMKRKKPFVVLFLGPNGAGKTTSIAKLTHLLQQRQKTVVWAAADTFRAASIEQLEAHAARLHVRVVKHQYGADPTAVAFDAVKAAQSSGADAVFIDSAGRQETNANLLNELKKMDRVIKPDLKIYVGEAYTGQALLHQAKEFDQAIGLHGFILSKIDTDAKGGTAISLLHQLKKPILFIGTGQAYTDLVEFKPEYILKRIVG